MPVYVPPCAPTASFAYNDPNNPSLYPGTPKNTQPHFFSSGAYFPPYNYTVVYVSGDFGWGNTAMPDQFNAGTYVTDNNGNTSPFLWSLPHFTGPYCFFAPGQFETTYEGGLLSYVFDHVGGKIAICNPDGVTSDNNPGASPPTYALLVPPPEATITSNVPYITAVYDSDTNEYSIPSGALITWSVTFAEGASITPVPGVLSIPPLYYGTVTGSFWVYPQDNTEYTLTAYGICTNVTASVTIYIVYPPPDNLYLIRDSGIWEVGQRTYEFLGDYQYQVTPSLHPRDDVFLTAIKQEIRLSLNNIGDENLPTWMVGSGDQYTGFPDSSPLHAIYDLYSDLVPLKTLTDALISVGPFSSLTSSYQSCQPRKAFILNNVDTETLSYQIEDSTTQSLFTLDENGNVQIRPASSFYDFCTAFDPVFIELGQSSSVLIRNLDPVAVNEFTSVTGFSSVEVSQLSPYIAPDDPACFIWSDSHSLSDTVTMPQALAQKPSSSVFDLSGGTVHACTSPSGFLNAHFNLNFIVH